MPATISIVDDEQGVRAPQIALINKIPGFRVIGCYGSGAETLRQVPLHPPDILLLDVVMPRMSGLQCARRLEALGVGVKFIFMTGFPDTSIVEEIVHFRGSSLLVKPFTAAELGDALKAAASGGVYLSPGAKQFLGNGRGAGRIDERSESLSRLTPTQVKVLTAYRRCMRYKEVAGELGCATRTVDAHMSAIRASLRVHTAMQAVRKVFGGSP
jgi:DNA-binding NarL/FixJ family response regulator